MDSNVRSIETLRAERERLAELPETGETPSAEGVLAEPAIFRHRVVTLTEERREQERILPPGGVLGATGGAYKMLRAQVLRRLEEIGANSIAVLSASNGEGKTLSAINLAIAVAADPSHTALLVDLDLRNPSVHRRFGFEPELGIEDCVELRRPVHHAMVRVAGYERLMIVPARSRVEMSSELIGTQRLADLVHELRSRYTNRIVIFDLPPVLLADDALAFAPLVQAGLFVVAEGRTQRSDLTRSLELLHRLPIVGTALNLSREPAGIYY